MCVCVRGRGGGGSFQIVLHFGEGQTKLNMLYLICTSPPPPPLFNDRYLIFDDFANFSGFNFLYVAVAVLFDVLTFSGLDYLYVAVHFLKLSFTFSGFNCLYVEVAFCQDSRLLQDSLISGWLSPTNTRPHTVTLSKTLMTSRSFTVTCWGFTKVGCSSLKGKSTFVSRASSISVF